MRGIIAVTFGIDFVAIGIASMLLNKPDANVPEILKTRCKKKYVGVGDLDMGSR